MYDLKENEIKTGVGRVVMGDCFNGRDKDLEGRPLTIKNGANAGQPRVDYFVGLAIPKDAPEWPEIWNKINAVARAGFPAMFDAAGNCVRPDFAFKVIDGDSPVPNTKNVAPNTREGFPGHWVLSFSQGFAPKVVAQDPRTELIDPKAIKRGDYVRILATVKANGSEQNPGVFLNHSVIQLCGYGEEIVVGIDAAAVMDDAPALPAGASTTPTAPAAVPGVPAAPAAVPGVPAAPVAAAPAPAADPAAAPDWLDPGEAFSHGGQTYAREQLTAAGWTDEQINALPRA